MTAIEIPSHEPKPKGETFVKNKCRCGESSCKVTIHDQPSIRRKSVIVSCDKCAHSKTILEVYY